MLVHCVCIVRVRRSKSLRFCKSYTTLADDFILMHKVAFKDKSWDITPAVPPVLASQKSTSNRECFFCFFCKASSHLIANCPSLKKNFNPKPVGLISGNFRSIPADNTSDSTIHYDNTGYGPFMQRGPVFIPILNKPVPVRILHDTGAALSFIFRGGTAIVWGDCYLRFWNGSYGGSVTHLKSELVTGSDGNNGVINKQRY